MQRNHCLFAAVAASIVTCLTHAGFVGLQSEKTVVGGKNVWRVYAKFSSPNDVLLSCSGLQGMDGTGWNDVDGFNGTWAPQYTFDATLDSFVTIGGEACPFCFENTTVADEAWGALGFQQPGIPNGAGWFNANPENLQGKADAVTLRTLIGQWVYPGDELFNPNSPLTVSYNQGLGTPTQFAQGTFIFFPSPGAIAVFGCAAVTPRRRRRC
ncbi:MAG: hypothetical protein JNL80_14340 [Phycisphaerae bacterium]|jgi:hypothetical protein|nr:hypothetical protein [Phycisphaerae bacterium]